jgi:arylsulfatase A-like enzyme
MQFILSCLCALVMVCGTLTVEARPNIILIIADDLGWEGVSAYGSRDYHTPNIDALARQGMRFEHAYATPLCSPSRVQMMTGKYLIRPGVYEHWGKLRKGETTIAHALQRAGYATLTAGKWQLKSGGGQDPREAGFDDYFIWPSRRYSRYWGPTFDHNGQVQTYARDVFGPNLIADYVNDWIANHRTRPFFVLWSMVEPHVPAVTPPDSDAETTKAKIVAMWEYGDKMIGRVVDQLDALGLRRDTLIIVTSDNGSSSAAETTRVVTDTGVQLVEGQKGRTTMAGTRVPFVVRWPGVVPARSVNRHIVDVTTSIFPTLAAVGEAQTPRNLDGRSILPTLRGSTTATWGHVYTWYDVKHPVVDRFNQFSGEYAQDKRWKLYRWNNCEQRDWLFDVQNDPRELQPIARINDTATQRAARNQLAKVIRGVKPTSTQPVSCRR